MSVVENGIVMALICLDQSLKTPKYIAVFNLAFVDVLGNSALVPKVIDTFWFNNKLVAITFPLRYQIIVSLKNMFSLVASLWIFSILVNLIAVGLLTRLSYCRGFSGTPHINYYYFFLLVLYIMSVVENSVVMALICLDQSLKTPKYIAVFNLAFVDVVGSSALVPKVIDTFWFDHKLVAITFPLRYQIIVSLKTMFSLIAACWIIAILVNLIAVGLLTRLSFCSFG
ncbi:unnamed protein product [Arctogadus glacialis]